MIRVAFHTLGCRLNMAETALAADDLTRHGYICVEETEQADIVVINSCAVTGTASQKSRQAVRAARRRHPGALIVLMGCDAKIDETTWTKEEGPDLVIPHPAPAPLSTLLARHNDAARRLVPAGEAMDGFTIEGAARFSERTRANLKIQDGCDFCCTYCAIPAARGRARSRSAEDIFREARELCDAGYRELVLCGVNISLYFDSGLDLAGLLGELAERHPSLRIRIGSAEPGEVIPHVVEQMNRHRNICRFLHLPLQYGNDRILEKMGRLYSTAEYAEQLLEAYRRIEGICLGADVITGFPGETDEDFAECREFLASLPFGLLHIFPFSPRPGTVAATMAGRPSGKVVSARTDALLELAREKARSFAEGQLKKTVELLIEDAEERSGWTDNYLHVRLQDGDCARNDLLSVRLVRFLGERECEGVRS